MGDAAGRNTRKEIIREFFTDPVPAETPMENAEKTMVTSVPRIPRYAIPTGRLWPLPPTTTRYGIETARMINQLDRMAPSLPAAICVLSTGLRSSVSRVDLSISPAMESAPHTMPAIIPRAVTRFISM
ncbi:MAG: hypothetical protein A4E64_01612 [Syntrophorhabdus sp. PtaU1.Bin058]|nr:MAG: hypothetical protein A4E64_01612 [Syntrophorhabdus sp. PtaU1.Bin058]